MPKGKKVGGKDFVKGHKGMGGRPKTPPEIKELRTMNRQEVEKLVNQYWMFDELTIEKFLADKTLPARDKLVLRVIRQGTRSGDASTLTFLTNFIFGEQPKRIQFDGNMNSNVSNVSPDVMAEAMKKLKDEF